MDINETMTVRYEACCGHRGAADEPCDTCGWLEDDHGHEAELVALPELPLAA
jgi:hypothetical protein